MKRLALVLLVTLAAVPAAGAPPPRPPAPPGGSATPGEGGAPGSDLVNCPACKGSRVFEPMIQLAGTNPRQ